MTVTSESNPYPVGPTGPVYLSTAELSARLRVTESALRQWRHEGYGPLGVKFGARVLYPLPEIEAYEQQALDAARREQARRANPQPIAHLPRRMSS